MHLKVRGRLSSSPLQIPIRARSCVGSFSVVGLSGSANWLNLVEVGVVAAGVAAVEGLRDLHTEELEVVLILPEVAEGEQLLQVLLYLFVGRLDRRYPSSRQRGGQWRTSDPGRKGGTSMHPGGAGRNPAW